MPVAVWLNENRIHLTESNWVGLINEIEHIFSDIFNFNYGTVELFGNSNGEEEVFESIPRDLLSQLNTFSDLIGHAIRKRLALRFTGQISYPMDLKTNLEFYLWSDERKTSSDILFDSDFNGPDLLDIIWENNERFGLAMNIQERIGSIKVDIDSKTRKIIDTITMAYDIPDVENLKNPGVLLFYSSRKGEYTLLDKILNNYAEMNPEHKDRISLFKTKLISSKIYSAPVVKEKLKHFGRRVVSVPSGSYAFISKDPTGFSSMVNFLEKSIVIPSIKSFPRDSFIIQGAVEAIKKVKDENQNTLSD